MPTISDREVTAIGQSIQKRDNQIKTLRKRLSDSAVVGNVTTVGIGIGGAAAMGYARGKFQDQASGAWTIPGTTVDVELVALVGLIGVALAGDALGLKKFQKPAADLAAGIGGHYAGQVGRKFAQTGKLSLVAGGSSVGALPQYDPTSYDPTQFSAPYDDPVASALGSAGV